ncbi:c-type cytochrome biogenesis protein CcsB [Plantactinospora endophytica]|uniref:C-type cytochrome biogenesis protein CcsB n=1 Tax=Plantactinospora endophytica TaxID=673535 RepID=A0ABQ4E8L3_9ACTN|nr:c-type cytochrome biogenesis protein CcsB [Plantactinospora endophytica]GIG91059.1 c-type cytochrome biogenesis protein CcsB [Plantactinospora endophytica]
MAALSDQLLVVAILGYLLAMICHAVEYAFGTRSVIGRAAARPERERVLVGAGVGAAGGSAPVVGTKLPGVDVPTPAGGSRSPRAVLAGRAAVAFTVLGAVVHLAVLITRGIAAERMPWGNMYEYLLSVTFVGVVGWLVLLYRRPTLRHLGLFVALAMVLLLAVAGLVLYVPIVPLVPALDSYWFVVHVATIAVSSGILLLGAVPAVMYLLRHGYDQGKRSFPYSLGARVPAADTLERLTFRLHAFAFPLFTFAVMAGAVWAEAAWGRYWGWDPKEIWAFISWVVYAGYLHARATPSVKRPVATWIAVLGFLTMQMNLYGVNIFFEGLHSYGGLD